MLATGANGQPAMAVYARDDDGQLQPYGVCVLTVTDRGISRVTSFGNPALLAVFGFPPEPGMTGPSIATSRQSSRGRHWSEPARADGPDGGL